MMCKYPDIDVELIGKDGNALNLMGLVVVELRRNDISKQETDAFFEEAMSGDYDRVLQTCMAWVNVT